MVNEMEQYWIPLACVSMLCNLILAVALRILSRDYKELQKYIENEDKIDD